MLFTERREMDIMRLNTCYCSFVMLIAMVCIVQPVLADNGTVVISYRGPGGYYIGDTIVFDGRDTAGNSIMVKITGPGLPSQGVPLFDLNGIPGSGNTVPVNKDNVWRFTWYSANTAGIEKLVTARYTITAADLSNPEKTATTSILLKKPEFYINPQTVPIHQGDYVELNGIAERDVTYVKIDITDSFGTVMRVFFSPVSGSGSFNYGFHSDIPPGRYQVTVSNPSMKNSLTTILTIEPPEKSGLTLPEPGNVTVTPDISPALTQPVTTVVQKTPVVPLSLLTAIAGLIISAGFVVAWSKGQKK